MKVTLIQHTPEPEKLIAAAAKLCYSDSSCENIMDGLDEEKTINFVKMLSDLGHESPIEHISFTFGIEGVSRSLLAQITRHRIASFSVQSQRYVKKDNFIYITPPAISENREINNIYEKSILDSFEQYNKIADMLSEKYYNEFRKILSPKQIMKIYQLEKGNARKFQNEWKKRQGQKPGQRPEAKKGNMHRNHNR